MKALVFDDGLKVRELPIPDPPPGEALVKVSLAGICNTDLEITRGYMGFQGVLGHEFVGYVAHARDESLVGKRVVGEINAGCGTCPQCAAGMDRHCPERTVLGILGRDGAMAEYLLLPERNLVPVPNSVSDEQAVFTEPLAAALEILEQVHLEPRSRVLVIGDGKLGLLIAMVLGLTGVELTVLGKHREKLSILEPRGIRTVTPDEAQDESDPFDVVVEASGNSTGWSLAVEKVKPRGTIVLKSTYHGAFDFNPAPLVINEITVVGSRCGRFEPAVRMLERKLVDVSPLIAGEYSIDDGLDAFDAARTSGNLKIVIRM